MKAKCVDNFNDMLYLTVGKIYEVLEDIYGNVEVINDKGKRRPYSSKRFQILKEEIMERKILGYEVPEDLFGGIIRKGKLYKECPSDKFYNLQEHIDDECGEYDRFALPAEIVTKWKAVYEEESLEMTVEGVNLVIKLDGLVHYKKKDRQGSFMIGEIKYALGKLSHMCTIHQCVIGGYDVYPIVSSVRIGCDDHGPRLSLFQLQNIIDQYTEFFKKD